MKPTLLFLELPLLDNDVNDQREHLRLAGVYLRSAVERSAERRYFKPQFLSESAYGQDDAHLVQSIIDAQPDVIACTLYLWNVERSLGVLRAVRRRLTGVRILAGGPEVARDHPFLFRSRIPDVAVVGEGEAIIPGILHALRTGKHASFSTVAWKTRRGYQWGTQPAPVLPLQDALPPTRCSYYRPDRNGMAYLETSRGCLRHCVYCRYHHFRRGVSFLPPDDVARRVRACLRKGAKEIRFIDPAFNTHPEWETILRKLVSVNAARSVRFFAEVNADLLQPGQARLLARSHFTEIEVGVQSRDPRVLRRIGRPAALRALDRGIRWMLAEGIRVTVDLMLGLPGQDMRDIRNSVHWAARLKGARVQCLQTLLLPGTAIRTHRRQWQLTASSQPPYAVCSTSALSVQAMRRALAHVQRRIGRQADCPTRTFIGRALPDLFPEQIHISIPDGICRRGSQVRRALVFNGADLFAHRRELVQAVRTAIRLEPNILWQFVLALEWEEPLDLIDLLIRELRRWPLHLNDRWIALDSGGRRAARRIMVWLGRRRYDVSWVKAVDVLLRESFY